MLPRRVILVIYSGQPKNEIFMTLHSFMFWFFPPPTYLFKGQGAADVLPPLKRGDHG